MHGSDLLRSAQKILDHSEEEADFRNAIHSAYYGVFHLGLELQKLLNLPSYQSGSELGSHESLIEACLHCTNHSLSAEVKLKLKAFGFTLKDLKNFRHKADYKHDITIGKEEADYVIGQAQKAFARFQEIQILILEASE
jgi:uncharacterized protein (UPF0332 family)